MKKMIIVAGISAAAAILGAGAALAQGKGATAPPPPMAKAVNETGEESGKVDPADGMESFARANDGVEKKQRFDARKCAPKQKKKGSSRAAC